MKKLPLLALLSACTFAADEQPVQKHEISLSLNTTTNSPLQFLNRSVGSFDVITVPGAHGKSDTLLLDRHTGQTWLYIPLGSVSNYLGWLSVPFISKDGETFRSPAIANEWDKFVDEWRAATKSTNQHSVPESDVERARELLRKYIP